MTSSQRKTVFITGANRGIGRETAQRLATAGFHVFVGARDARAGEETVKAIAKGGAPVTAIVIDVADSRSIAAAAKELGRHTSALDVLINNAGIYPDEGLNILTISREQLTTTFQTNTFGPVAVTQAFLPLLKAARGARVINISSGFGAFEGLSPDVPSYCLSKLTLNGVTVMLANALKSSGIAVNSVCPGWVKTDMGGPNAPRSIEQGADTPVWLATEAPQQLTGTFLRDCQQIAW